MTRILAGTREGLHVFEDGRALDVQRIGWETDDARPVTALARAGSEQLAIVDRHEIWRSADGDAWTHVVSSVNLELECLADTVAGVIVGTSQAHLLRVEDPPTPLATVTAFDEVEGRDDWYTPWGGPPATRSISEDDDAVYANVHVGGIVRSRDRGQTWEPTIDIDADVHRVWAGTPWVFAACARGLAVSRDGGDSWAFETDGLHSTYCRGVTVCGDTVLLSASNGPRGGRGAIYRRALAGGPLERCRAGLQEWFDGNIDSACLDATPELAAFGTGEGRVFASEDEGSTWHEVATGLPAVECLSVTP